MEVNTKSDSSATKKSESTWAFCEVCGKASRIPICAACADRIRAEALARKKREDKGLE